MRVNQRCARFGGALRCVLCLAEEGRCQVRLGETQRCWVSGRHRRVWCITGGCCSVAQSRTVRALAPPRSLTGWPRLCCIPRYSYGALRNGEYQMPGIRCGISALCGDRHRRCNGFPDERRTDRKATVAITVLLIPLRPDPVSVPLNPTRRKEMRLNRRGRS